ncbi:MAG: nitrogenase component 1, partial [Methanolinea sp.]
MNSPLEGGCTLTGALSVTTEIEGAVTVIHGPAGCAHHNFSLFHALCAGRDDPVLPAIVSTDLSESDIIFGGEESLERTLREVAAAGNCSLVCVLQTCVSGAIGDDVDSVCGEDYGVPVVPIPTAGFLGGGFHDGHVRALLSLVPPARGGKKTISANIVGEKTLEFEREAHYGEVSRLLSAIGVPVCTRFVCRSSVEGISRLPQGAVNILRDPSMVAVGEHLEAEFGTPYVSSFPLGPSGTIRFLEELGEILSLDVSTAVAGEKARQERIFWEFRHLRGERIRFCEASGHADSLEACREIAEA